MPPSRNLVPVEFVSEAVIRQHFNEGRFWERVQSGDLRADLKRNGHPATLPAGEPSCTHSQTLNYYASNGELIAVVHQYKRPDGSLGGSGRPDPKWLSLSGRALAVRSRIK